MAVDIPQLMKMSQAELDALFTASPAGDIPNGDAAGTAIIAPGTQLEETAAKFIHLIAWQGKVFDAAKGELRNKLLPFGVQAVIAPQHTRTWLIDALATHRRDRNDGIGLHEMRSWPTYI